MAWVRVRARLPPVSPSLYPASWGRDVLRTAVQPALGHRGTSCCWPSQVYEGARPVSSAKQRTAGSVRLSRLLTYPPQSEPDSQ